MTNPFSSHFETIVCPLCGEARFRILAKARFPSELTQDFLTQTYRSSSDQTLYEQIVRCAGCGLVYLNPRLRSDLIIGAYAAGEDQAFVEQDTMRARTFSSALHDLARRFGFTPSPATKVLDIGCAGGAFVRAATDFGVSASGIEPSRWLAEHAHSQGLDVRPGTLAEHSFPEASFDMVTLWDVIEHLTDPGSELERIYRILKPSGLLVVNYPDYGSLPARFMGRKWPFLLSVHLIYYTRRTMRRQLAAKGFVVVDMERHWQTLELEYVLKRAGAYFGLFRLLATAVRRLGLSRLPIKYWIGQTRVVARKQ